MSAIGAMRSSNNTFDEFRIDVQKQNETRARALTGNPLLSSAGGAAPESAYADVSGALPPSDDGYSLEELTSWRSIFWKATGIWVFRLRADFSNASATSFFEISPVENFAIASSHMTDSDFPKGKERRMIVPLACAHLIISAVV
jgi:hypothetical protein